MHRSPTWLLAVLPWAALACQIHHPQLGPNVEQLDREREQLDRFVAAQKPLPEHEDRAARETCTREIEARAAHESDPAWDRSKMDAAVRECVNARQPSGPPDPAE